MKAVRIVCPSCKAERREISDEGNMHEYAEEVTSEVCTNDTCQEWYNSPEQRLLRALFGVKDGAQKDNQSNGTVRTGTPRA